MRHPLHSIATGAMLRCAGEMERRTGRSTAMALRTIADAISNPREDIVIRDHYEPDGLRVQTVERLQADRIKRLVESMGLDHMHVTRSEGGFALRFARAVSSSCLCRSCSAAKET